MTVLLQYKGGTNWRVKKQNHISISKAPGALFRKNTVFIQGTKAGTRKDQCPIEHRSDFPKVLKGHIQDLDECIFED